MLCFLDFQVLFFGGGWVFFLKQLFRDYEVRIDLCSFFIAQGKLTTLWKTLIYHLVNR